MEQKKNITIYFLSVFYLLISFLYSGGAQYSINESGNGKEVPVAVPSVHTSDWRPENHFITQWTGTEAKARNTTEGLKGVCSVLVPV